MAYAHIEGINEQLIDLQAFLTTLLFELYISKFKSQTRKKQSFTPHLSNCSYLAFSGG